MTIRNEFTLTSFEQRWFDRLPPIEGAAVVFWKKAAFDRGLDPASVISNGYKFTALPEGHGKHWCFPSPLQCKRKPVYTGI